MPYQIAFKISGFFSFPPDTEEETIQKMVGLNALAVLYGIARGVVAQVTANGPHGKFILPTVNFVEMLKKKVGAGDLFSAGVGPGCRGGKSRNLHSAEADSKE